MSVSVTPDNSSIVSGSEDTTIKKWNLQNGNLEKTYQASGTIIYIKLNYTIYKIYITRKLYNIFIIYHLLLYYINISYKY